MASTENVRSDISPLRWTLLLCWAQHVKVKLLLGDDNYLGRAEAIAGQVRDAALPLDL